MLHSAPGLRGWGRAHAHRTGGAGFSALYFADLHLRYHMKCTVRSGTSLRRWGRALHVRQRQAAPLDPSTVPRWESAATHIPWWEGEHEGAGLAAPR